MRADRVSLAALLTMLALFAAALVLLARTRYARGDGYPEASSLRTDPLGTKALHDALACIDGVEVLRHTGRAATLSGGRGTAVLVLGADPSLSIGDPDLVAAIEGVALAGGRVLVGVESSPDSWYERLRKPHRAMDKKPEEKESGDDQDRGLDPETRKPLPPPLTERWGYATTACGAAALEPVAVPAEGSEIEGDIPWRGPNCLDRLAPAWKPLYTRAGKTAVAERTLGQGSVVLLADAYLLSNEALSIEPRPAAVARLLGPARTIVFEESHLGVRDRPGIVALARRYRLHGTLAVALLLFGLSVWRAAVPLAPAQAHRAAAAIAGREASLGLVSLLRRGVPADRIVAACVEEWRRTSSRRADAPEDAGLDEAIAAVGRRDRDPLAAYGRIQEAIRRMRPMGERHGR
jgi:hypothetical protein